MKKDGGRVIEGANWKEEVDVWGVEMHQRLGAIERVLKDEETFLVVPDGIEIHGRKVMGVRVWDTLGTLMYTVKFHPRPCELTNHLSLVYLQGEVGATELIKMDGWPQLASAEKINGVWEGGPFATQTILRAMEAFSIVAKTCEAANAAGEQAEAVSESVGGDC